MKASVTIPIYVFACLGSAMASGGQDYHKLFPGCGNSTLNTTIPLNTTACASDTVPTRTTSSLRTIYTNSSNYTPAAPKMYVHDLKASINQETKMAEYSFRFIIEPDWNAMICRVSLNMSDGRLPDVQSAQCFHDAAHRWLRPNHSMLAHFSFAWKDIGSYNGSLLVLRSSNPASANHCPDFPHDACWAQGLHRFAPGDIKWMNGRQRYAGKADICVNGTYCKSGNPDCAMSEYIYEPLSG